LRLDFPALAPRNKAVSYAFSGYASGLASYVTLELGRSDRHGQRGRKN
jgi:hypothetical protein